MALKLLKPEIDAVVVDVYLHRWHDHSSGSRSLLRTP